MTYRIEFDPAAVDEILEAARYIALDSPMNAQRWYHGIHLAVYIFGRNPAALRIGTRERQV